MKTLAFLLAVVCGTVCQAQANSSLKGSISGRVLDQDGQPLRDVRVTVWNWAYREGRRELDQVSAEQSQMRGDGGFAIGELDPGEYCVRVESSHLSPIEMPSPRTPAPGDLPVTTYFPGVVDPAAAATIQVTAGAETRGIEFRVSNAKTFHIRGKVVGPGFLQVMRPSNGSVSTDVPVGFPADGSISVTHLLPGSYVFLGGNGRFCARAEVTLADKDIDDLAVETLQCPRVSGTLTLDGRPFAMDGGAPAVGFASLAGNGTSYPQPAGNGSFSAPYVERDRYDLVLNLKPGIYLKSATLNGREASSPLDLTSTANKTIDIALASGAADVRGVARDENGKALPAARVTLWNFKGGYDLTVQSNPDGTFEFQNLAPGSYRLVAWDGLRPQAKGWGVQTVPEFRDAFETMANHVVLGENQHANVDPALIPREAIEQTAKRLKLNAVMTHPAEEAEISAAAKSPETLAAYLRSHNKVDWEALRKTLGLKNDEYWFAPCAADFLAGQSACVTQIEAIATPAQELLTITGGERSTAIEHLRYLKDSGGGWRFAGEINALGHYSAGTHRLTQFAGNPYLIVSTDHSQNGIGTQQTLEEWYDLTRPEFSPDFTFTPDGSQSRYGFGVGHTMKATCKISEVDGVESIEMTLAIDFDGIGLDLPATYTGVYERRPGEETFTLRRASIPLIDFEELADPFSDLSNEKLLQYALPGLQKIATGSDDDAKGWLRSVLEYANDTPEKRALLDLLSKH